MVLQLPDIVHVSEVLNSNTPNSIRSLYSMRPLKAMQTAVQ